MLIAEVPTDAGPAFVAAMGSCRLYQPFLAAVHANHLNMAYGVSTPFTYSAGEAEQYLAFSLGRKAIPQFAWQYVFSDPRTKTAAPELIKTLDKVSIFLSEISTLDQLTSCGLYFNINELGQKFVRNRGPEHARWWREVTDRRKRRASDEAVDQVLKALHANGEVCSDEVFYFLSDMRFETLDEDGLRSHFAALTRLHPHRWLFVSHFNIAEVGQEVMADRRVLLETLRGAAIAAGHSVFDPTGTVVKFGWRRALLGDGADKHHYSPQFEPVLGEDLIIAVRGAISKNRTVSLDEILKMREAANAAVIAQHWETAALAWEALRTVKPDEVDAYVFGTEALRLLGRIEDAEAIALEATKRFPDTPWVFHSYAGMAGYRGDWVEALRRWEAIRIIFPHDYGAASNAANTLVQLGRENEALPLFHNLVESHPNEPDGWIGLAKQALSSKQWVEAARHCETIRDRFPGIPAGWGFGVESLVGADRMSEAEELATKAVELFPRDLWLAHVFAGLASRRNDKAAATERWAAVRRVFPSDPAGYELGASALRNAGLLDEAMVVLRQAAMLFPSRVRVLSAMAEIAGELGEWSEAVALWADVRRRFPKEVNGYIQGVLALRRAGLFDGADSLTAEGYELFADSVDLALMQLEAMLNRSLEPDVLDLWHKCRNLGGENVPHFYTLSWRVYLVVHKQPRSIAVLDVLAAEPISARPTEVPSLMRGLAWCLQSGDSRFAEVHCSISERLRTMSNRASLSLPLVLLGLATPDVCTQVIWERLLAPPSQVTKILFSSFEGHQASAAKVQSGIDATLRAALNRAVQEISAGTLVPTANLSYNILFHAFALNATLFRTAATTLIACSRGTDRGRNEMLTVWDAVSTICSAAMPAGPTKETARSDATTHRRLRIALCVSGQVRGFRNAFATWNRLALDRHDVTTVVHVWRHVGAVEMALANEQRGFPRSFVQKYNQLVLQVGLQTLRARFPGFYGAFSVQGEVTESELQKTYGTEYVVVEDDRQDEFAKMTNPAKMYYKVQAAQDLARSLGIDFDLFIRFRPDKEIVNGHVDWEEVLAKSLRERTVFCDYGPVITPMGDLIVGDQFAVACGEVMDVYAKTWSDAKSGLSSKFGYEREFKGHINFGSNLLYNGVTVEGVPGLSFGSLLNPEAPQMDRLQELVASDAARCPGDEIAIQFLAAFA